MDTHEIKVWHYNKPLYTNQVTINHEQIPKDRQLSWVEILENLYTKIDDFLASITLNYGEEVLTLKANIDPNYAPNTIKLFFYVYFSPAQQKRVEAYEIYQKFDDFYFEFLELIQAVTLKKSSNKDLEVSLSLIDNDEELEEFDYANLISKDRILIELPLYLLNTMDGKHKTSVKSIIK